MWISTFTHHQYNLQIFFKHSKALQILFLLLLTLVQTLQLTIQTHPHAYYTFQAFCQLFLYFAILFVTDTPWLLLQFDLLSFNYFTLFLSLLVYHVMYFELNKGFLAFNFVSFCRELVSNWLVIVILVVHTMLHAIVFYSLNIIASCCHLLIISSFQILTLSSQDYLALIHMSPLQTSLPDISSHIWNARKRPP